MALDLGELYGTVGIKEAPFQGGLDRAFDALTGFGSKAAKKSALIGAAVATAIGVSLIQNIDAEAANDKLAAQLGLTEAESQRIGSVAGSLYADAYGESMADVNNAVAAVMGSIEGMREASSADLEDVTAKALDFATAFEVDVTRAAQVAGQMLKTGMAGDATEAFDLLVAASQKVQPALREDLLDAVDEYGPMFSQLGYSGEQAFALLVDASEKGMYGIDKAGDAVKEFTIRATDMSSASQEAYAAIGLDAQKMSNDILAGGDTANAATQKVIDGLLGIKDPATQANTAIALFGTPLEDLGTNEIPAFLEALRGTSGALGEVGGASERMGETLNSNASASLTSIKRQAEQAMMGLANWLLPAFTEVTAVVAEQFGPALRDIGGAISDAVAWLDKLLEPIGGNETAAKALAVVLVGILIPALITWGVTSTVSAAKAVAAWVATQGAAAKSAAVHVATFAMMVAKWALTAAQATANAARIAAAWLVTQRGAAKAAAAQAIAVAAMAAGWVLAGVQALAGAAKVAAAWLIAMGPIALVIAAVAGIVVIIVKYWDEIKAFTKAAWDWIVGAIKGAIDWVVQLFLNFTGPGLIIKHWESIKSTVSDGVSNVVGFVSGLPGKIKNALTGAAGWLLEVGKDVMRGLRDGIEAGFDWVKNKLKGVGKLIPGWLKSVLGINSPSRVMRAEVGVWIPAGVADGIEDGIPLVDKSMAKMLAATEGTAQFGAGLQASMGIGGSGPSIEVASPTVQVFLDGEEISATFRPVAASEARREITRQTIAARRSQ